MRLDALFLPLALAACNTGVGTDLTRTAAKSVVNSVVAERFPGVPLAPATDCIIDNSTSDEIITLASAAATRDDAAASQVVLDVARRPDTLRCLGSDALPIILTTL
ncbi:MAG: succinate dehydrogenase [Jannaschia sp.]